MPHRCTLTSNIVSDPSTRQGAVSVQLIQVVCHPPAGLSSPAHTSSAAPRFTCPQEMAQSLVTGRYQVVRESVFPA